MLIFERHTGCLLAARLRPGNASSHARIVPMLVRLVPRLEAAFPGANIKLRGDAGFALPLLYQFCEFFDIEYALGIPPTAFSNNVRNLAKSNSNGAIAAPSYRSAASPASAIVPAPGRVSAASATRPNTPPPEPTCAL